MPNTKNIDRVMNAIRAEQLFEFDMNYTCTVPEGKCGTAACIMGFAAAIAKSPQWAANVGDDDELQEVACEFLGIHPIDAEELFWARESNIRLSEIPKSVALTGLEDLKQNRFITWEDYFLD